MPIDLGTLLNCIKKINIKKIIEYKEVEKAIFKIAFNPE
tara:strand:+ start:88 stop:204 length:117 start_codon:yes stop_codon:yes gene_type:complete